MKKFGSSLLYLLEVVIPAISFFVLFIVFLITIISRYILHHPVPWTMEVSVLAYLWVVYFGAAWCARTDSNVVFSLVYDSCSKPVQRIFRILQNLVLIIFISIVFVPFSNRILNMTTHTGVLYIPFRYAYIPFIIMMVLLVLHAGAQIVSDWRRER